MAATATKRKRDIIFESLEDRPVDPNGRSSTTGTPISTPRLVRSERWDPSAILVGAIPMHVSIGFQFYRL
eukprot:722297-Amorphochlora_amoeboformis.AAC.1